MACVYDQLEKILPELVAHASYHDGDVFSLTTKVEGIRVKFKKRLRKIIKIDGSLHRYYTKGNNDSLFTYKNLVEAVMALASQFGFSPHYANLQRIELGVNIPIENPEDMIDAAILFGGRTATKSKRTRKWYYKEWKFTEYTVKLYKKGEHKVRFEIRLFKKRQLDKLQLHTLSDLIDYYKFCKCLSHLVSSAKRFVFVPDYNSTTPISVKAKVAKWRNESYWRQFNDKNKSTKSRRIDEINDVIKDYCLPDWRSILENGIREQGDLMISPEDATFSQLGLQMETVAGTEGDRNRLEDDSPLVNAMGKNYLIQIHNTDAYGWWRKDVYIYAASYVPLLPRGPPSAILVCLLLMYEYNVALLIPVRSSISLIGMVPASYNASACSMALALALGLPPLRPRARV